jgi:hypothetical protein
MMKLRNSERGSWKTCRWRWSWTWRDGLQALEAPIALRFGDLIHRALAAYRPPGRKFGSHPAKTFEALYLNQAAELRDQGFDVFTEDKWVDALDLGRGMLNNYVETFQDADAQWEVLSSEQTFQRVIRAPASIREGDPVPGTLEAPAIYIPAFSFRIVGTLDGVWKHIKSKHVVFAEYKTAAAISEDGLSMDEQPTVYWTYGPKWLVQRGMISEADAKALREILYTFLRKAVPNEDRPVNGDGLYLNKPTKEALIKRLNERKPSQVYSKLKVDDLMDVLRKLGDHPELLGEVSKVQPAPYFRRVPVRRDAADRARLHERLLEEAREIWLARQGIYPIYKNPGPLHNPNCRGCAVRAACEVHEAGGDHRSVLNATTTKWAPYAAHELAERT